MGYFRTGGRVMTKEHLEKEIEKLKKENEKLIQEIREAKLQIKILLDEKNRTAKELLYPDDYC